MVSVVICSGDLRLAPMLAAALGPGYSVRIESKRERVMDMMMRSQVDVLLLDLESRSPSLGEDLAFVDAVKHHHVPLVAMTADGTRATALEFLQQGVEFVRKPPSIIELKVLVNRAYKHASLRRELEVTRQKLSAVHGCDRLIGSSGPSQVVYDLIRRVTNLSAFVLITGESGTGKELVARSIHNLSNRAKAPFVAVSCGAIPETLIEAELFGHEKGAFTGTTGSREGKLELAGDGTLLMDEIGELSLATQVKLLRVLQERSFSPLGSNKLIPLKARVLFATHRDLGQMVEKGTFRQDLYFRVNVFRINVPPLRDRREDIALLANHFLRQYATAYKKLVHDILPSAMMTLVKQDWPGNIRELENVIQSAVILAEGESIGPDDLPESLQSPQSVPSLPEFLGDSFDGQIRNFKLKLVAKALVDSNGNKTRAARNLSISRAYLHRLLHVSSMDGRAA
jgi:DNA-binding NtrC family response regulator